MKKPAAQAILERMLILKEEKKRIEDEEGVLWKELFAIADYEAGPQKPFRHLDPELGMVIGRIISTRQSIDPNRLEKLLTHSQWIAISIPARILEPARLEVALQQRKVPAEAVEAATERKVIQSKFGPRPASKEDMEALQDQEAERRAGVREEAR